MIRIKSWWTGLKTERKFLFVLIGYFLLHTLVRVFISNSLEFDEAEQILFSQQLSFGYGSQPPLYEWVQKVFFSIFGLNIFSLAIFKNSLFVLIYFFLYKSAQIILKDNLRAILASSALLVTYTYGWQSMHQLTHAILALSLCSITFFIFLRLVETRATKHYLVLAVCVGLGILSKYNYLIFILALLFSAFSLKGFRKTILDKRMLLVLIIPVCISAGHFAWVALNFQQATLRLTEMQIDVEKTKGLLDLLICLLAILGPFCVIFVIFFPKAFTKNRLLNLAENQFKQLLERFFISAIVITVLWVLIFKIVDFEERWLQLIFFLFPTYLFSRLKGKVVSKLRVKVYSWLIIFSAFMLIFMLTICVLFPDTFGYKRLHYPIAELSKEIRAEGFDRGLVLSPDTSVAADIKLQFKDSLVLTHRIPFEVSENFDKILLIWGDVWWYDVPDELGKILPRHNVEAKRTNIAKKALYKYSKDEYYEIYLMVVDKRESSE
ncbi:MAG: glycosyltransferase family 39 protein [Candidatus Omnitrophica bacterium]|nr:glycosyltransferase family 39 protein [Candidatus Omnitrophota bacterium]